MMEESTKLLINGKAPGRRWRGPNIVAGTITRLYQSPRPGLAVGTIVSKRVEYRVRAALWWDLLQR